VEGHRDRPLHAVVIHPLDKKAEDPGLLPWDQGIPHGVEKGQGPGDLPFVHHFPAQGDQLLPDLGGPLLRRPNPLLEVRHLVGDPYPRAQLARQVPEFPVVAPEFPVQGLLFRLQLLDALAPKLAGLLQGLPKKGGIPADAPDLVHHELLDLLGRDRLGRAGVPAPPLGVEADVIPVSLVPLGGIGVDHGAPAGLAVQKPL